jgi:putative transcriptional regulator
MDEKGGKMDAITLNVQKRVKEARVSANLTQSELGVKIGKSKQWVSELERGNIRLSYEMAVNISHACNKSTDFFCQ